MSVSDCQSLSHCIERNGEVLAYESALLVRYKWVERAHYLICLDLVSMGLSKVWLNQMLGLTFLTRQFQRKGGVLPTSMSHGPSPQFTNYISIHTPASTKMAEETMQMDASANERILARLNELFPDGQCPNSDLSRGAQ